MAAWLHRRNFGLFCLFMCAFYHDYNQYGFLTPSIVGAFYRVPSFLFDAHATLNPSATSYSRTSSWMLPQPTAELPDSWWRGRNTVRSDSCSNVSPSQAWQPRVTGTPSSSTAWKPSREFHPRCAHSQPLAPPSVSASSHSLFRFLFPTMHLKLYRIPLSFKPAVKTVSP